MSAGAYPCFSRYSQASFALASTSWCIFASSSRVGTCSCVRDWLDLVLGCVVGGGRGRQPLLAFWDGVLFWFKGMRGVLGMYLEVLSNVYRCESPGAGSL